MGLKSIYTVLDVLDLGPLNLQTSALSKCFSSPTEQGKYLLELVYSMISEQQLFEYFIKTINGKAKAENLTVNDDTVCYLGNLLTHYSHSNNFLVEELSGKQLPTLALLYRDARESPNPNQRQNLLRKLGDSALFMGAWFAVLYQRKGIGKDYFIGMGTAAYDYLAEHALHQQTVFKDLALNLPHLMRLISRVLSREENLTSQEIFALYKRWLHTSDTVLEQQLQSLGILPVTSVTSVTSVQGH